MHRIPDHTPPSTALTPHSVTPSYEIEPVPAEGRRVAGYTWYAGQLLPVYERADPVLTPPRDLTPQPLLDREAQQLAGKGVFAAGAGVGAYFAAGAVSIVLDSLGQFLIAAAVVVAVMFAPVGKRRGTETGPVIINRGAFSGWFNRTGPRR